MTRSDPAIRQVVDLGFPWQTLDPFLFCVHHEDYFPQGNGTMGPDPALLAGRNIGMDFEIRDGWRMYHGDTVPGFPAHPHRGFETVTVVTRGFVDHADSMGAAGRYGEGDTQWMTAGKGVQHSEMFPLLRDDRDNTMELFQIWLNLPGRDKMTEPHFAMLWSEDTPIVSVEHGSGAKAHIRVIAGEAEGQRAAPPPPDSWAADPANEVGIWTIELEPGAEWTLPKAGKTVNRVAYAYRGSEAVLNETTLKRDQGAVLVPDADMTVRNRSAEPVAVLVLQGQPINEPVAKYGPFVMNTEAEIHQAFADFRRDEFGGWPWPRNDQVHEKHRGRFAKHADGRLEER